MTRYEEYIFQTQLHIARLEVMIQKQRSQIAELNEKNNELMMTVSLLQDHLSENGIQY